MIQLAARDSVGNVINPKGLHRTQPSRPISVRYGINIMHKEGNVIPKYGDKTFEQEDAEVVDGEINRRSQ